MELHNLQADPRILQQQGAHCHTQEAAGRTVEGEHLRIDHQAGHTVAEVSRTVELEVGRKAAAQGADRKVVDLLGAVRIGEEPGHTEVGRIAVAVGRTVVQVVGHNPVQI